MKNRLRALQPTNFRIEDFARNHSKNVCWQMLVLALAYFVCAEIGMWLAVPPVYTAPIWPAAGIAVWGLTIWGRNLWPGVFLGAFSSDLLHKIIEANWGITTDTVALTGTTAVGAVLQALFAAHCLHNLLISKDELTEEKAVLFRVLLAGPVACIISASIGIGSMYIFQNVPLALLGSNWLGWWAGDSIGVMLAIPLILLSVPSIGRWRRYFWRTCVLPVVVALLIGTAIIFLAQAEKAEYLRKVETSSELLHETLEHFLREQYQTVNSLADFFSASNNVTQQEFDQFTQRVVREGQVRGLAWIPRVPQQMRAEFEAKLSIMLTEPGQNGRLKSVTNRSEYYPIAYASQGERLAQLIGLDLGADPGTLECLLNAAETGRIRLDEREAFYDRGVARQDDWHVFVPVYQMGLDLTNSSPQRKLTALRGFAGVLVYFGDLTGILEALSDQYGLFFRVSLGRGLDQPIVLHDTRLISEKERPADWTNHPKLFGNNSFLLESWALTPWQPGQSLLMQVVLLASVMAMLGVSTFVIVAAGQSARINFRVLERTAELEAARKSAEQASKAKSDFLASMSHEIRTPLNGVIGMIDVLAQADLKHNQKEMIELMRFSSFSLLEVIDDILDFSKIESGKLVIDYQPVSLPTVVETTCDMLDQLAKAKGVELTLYTDPRLPKSVLGDSLRVRQILINLVSNAIKFSSPKQPGRVTVRALLQRRGKAIISIEFQVIDNGIGMDEEIQARLFQPFSQADASTTRSFGGSGLGLAICRQLVTMMDGQISVESAPGQGTSFKVQLPFQVAQGEAEHRADDYSSIRGLACLVIGSTGLARDLMSYLEFGGAFVARAEDLANAEHMSSRFPPGQCLWIVDVETKCSGDILRAAVKSWTKQDVLFVTIERGDRRMPRKIDKDHVMIDGNVLKHKAFLNTIAQAAGRLPWPENKTDNIFEKHHTASDQRAKTDKPLLIAEDNAVNQKVVQQQLALLGYHADIACDGREALDLWQRGGYALLLTDLHMPEMDGYQLTSEIRARQKGEERFPIIALTANALKGEDERCRAAGMDDYLSKPVQLVDLQAVLEKWLVYGDAKSLENARDVEAETDLPVDISVLEALVGNDAAVIESLLHEYYRSLTQHLNALLNAFSVKDFTAITETAHTLKSSSFSIGAQVLGDLCVELEQAAEAGDQDRVDLLKSAFTNEAKIVLEFINTRLGYTM